MGEGHFNNNNNNNARCELFYQHDHSFDAPISLILVYYTGSLGSFIEVMQETGN